MPLPSLPLTFANLQGLVKQEDADELLWSLLNEKWRRRPPYGANSLRGYWSALAILMRFMRQNADESAFDFQSYKKWLTTQGFVPSTVDKRLAQARFLLTEICGQSPSTCVVYRSAISDVTTPPYTDTQIESLLQHAYFEERIVIILALEAGLNVNEIARIRREDVDFEEDLLRLRSANPTKGTDNAVTVTEVSLSPLLKAELQRWFARTPNQQTHVAANISQAYINKAFQGVCLRAGVSCRGLKGLRVTAGARAYRETGDLQVVMQRLRLKTRQQAKAYASAAYLLSTESNENKEGTQ